MWARCVAEWAGKLISGRYAQPGAGLWGSITGDIGPGSLVSHQLPELISHIPKALLNAPDFWKRGALPHHNEIAVDEFPEKLQDNEIAAHGLYPDRASYSKQFHWRYNTAVLHIRDAFCKHWQAGCNGAAG